MSHKSLYRLFILCMILALLLALVPGCAQSKSKQVLLILDEQSGDMEYMLTKEVGVMVDMLTKAGFKVLTASDSGQQIVAGKTTLKPDMKITDVKVEDYAGLILPCMARLNDFDASPATLEVIKKAVAQEKLIAAQLGGVAALFQAGVMQGKQFTALEDAKDYYQGTSSAIYKGEGVVQDGNIITGGICPYIAKEMGKKDTTVELTQKFIDALKLQ
jgi:putative intracellular protease/amidase